MRDTNKQVTLRFIEAMGSNDPEAARACFADDGVAVTKGFSHFAGTRGADTVAEAIESFKALFPTGLRLDIKSVMADGDRVVVEAEGNAVTAEDKPYTNHYCFVATLRDGKILQFNEYLCSALAEQVLWPMVERMGALQLEEG